MNKAYSFYLLLINMFSVLGQWANILNRGVGNSRLSTATQQNVNFEDVQTILQITTSCPTSSTMIRSNEHEEIDFESLKRLEPLLISTIPIALMHRGGGGAGSGTKFPLISGTLAPELEEAYINELLETVDSVLLGEILVIIYGQNTIDKTVIEKAKQMYSLGFNNIYIYSGGMFEWCLLHDIYGNQEFPVEGFGKELIDPLFFKGKRLFLDG